MHKGNPHAPHITPHVACTCVNFSGPAHASRCQRIEYVYKLCHNLYSEMRGAAEGTGVGGKGNGVGGKGAGKEMCWGPGVDKGEGGEPISS